MLMFRVYDIECVPGRMISGGSFNVADKEGHFVAYDRWRNVVLVHRCCAFMLLVYLSVLPNIFLNSASTSLFS